MNVMNRRMFSNRDARSKLSNMGGIMGSSPELMSAGQQGFANGGQPGFLEKVAEFGRNAIDAVKGVDTYLVSLPNGEEFSLRSDEPDLGQQIGTILKVGGSVVDIETGEPFGAPSKEKNPSYALMKSLAPNNKQGQPGGTTTFNTRKMNMLNRQREIDEQADILAEASSMTPMDTSSDDPDFSGIMALQQAEEQQRKDFSEAAAAATNSRALMRERGMSATQQQKAAEDKAAAAANEVDLNSRLAEEDMAFAVDFPQGGARTFPKKRIFDSSLSPDGQPGGSAENLGIASLSPVNTGGSPSSGFASPLETARKEKELAAQKSAASQREMDEQAVRRADAIDFMQGSAENLGAPGVELEGYYSQFPLLTPEEDNPSYAANRYLMDSLAPNNKQGQPGGTTTQNTRTMNMLNRQREKEEQAVRRADAMDEYGNYADEYDALRGEALTIAAKKEAEKQAYADMLKTKNVDPNEASPLDAFATTSDLVDKIIKDQQKVISKTALSAEINKQANAAGGNLVDAANTLLVSLGWLGGQGGALVLDGLGMVTGGGETSKGLFRTAQDVRDYVNELPDLMFVGTGEEYVRDGLFLTKDSTDDDAAEMTALDNLTRIKEERAIVERRLDALSDDDPLFSDGNYSESVLRGPTDLGLSDFNPRILSAQKVGPELTRELSTAGTGPAGREPADIVVANAAEMTALDNLEAAAREQPDEQLNREQNAAEMTALDNLETEAGGRRIEKADIPTLLLQKAKDIIAGKLPSNPELKTLAGQLIDGYLDLTVDGLKAFAKKFESIQNNLLSEKDATAVTDNAVTDTAVTDNAVTDTAVTDTAVTDTAVTDTAVTAPDIIAKLKDKVDNGGGADSSDIARLLLDSAGFKAGDTETNIASYKKLIQEVMGGGPSDKQKNQEKWNNFAMIGFAIAAGQSPDAMSNIAAGMLEGTKLMSSQRTARAAREDKMNMFALEQASLDNRAAIRARTSGTFTAEERQYNEALKTSYNTLVEELYGEPNPATGGKYTLKELYKMAQDVAGQGPATSGDTQEPVSKKVLKLTQNVLRAKELNQTLEQVYANLDKNKAVYNRKLVRDIYEGNK